VRKRKKRETETTTTKVKKGDPKKPKKRDEGKSTEGGAANNVSETRTCNNCGAVKKGTYSKLAQERPSFAISVMETDISILTVLT
jgi:hypothetical protein